jgi:hypothetical protein
MMRAVVVAVCIVLMLVSCHTVNITQLLVIFLTGFFIMRGDFSPVWYKCLVSYVNRLTFYSGS